MKMRALTKKMRDKTIRDRATTIVTFLGARASLGNHDPVKAINIANGLNLMVESSHETRRRVICEVSAYNRRTLLPGLGMDELLVADLSGYR